MVQISVSSSFSAISCSHGEEACGHSVQLEAIALQVDWNQMFNANNQSDGHIPANTSLCLTPPNGTSLANPCIICSMIDLTDIALNVDACNDHKHVVLVTFCHVAI